MWHYQVIQYKKHVELVEYFVFKGVKLLKSGEIVETKKMCHAYTPNLLVDKYGNVKDLEDNLKLMLKDVKKYKPIHYKKLPKAKK